MKIAISARMLRENPSDGISRFTSEVISRLVSACSDFQTALIFDRNPGYIRFGSGNYETHVLTPETRHPVLWYLWHEKRLPALLRKINADLFLSPDGIISLRTDIPSIPVIHDINFIHRPKDIPFLTSLYYRHFFPQFAEKAARVLTVSEFCREDISTTLNIDPAKIDIAYNGVSDYFFPADEAEKATFRKNLTGGAPYLIFVGNFSPRKNIPGLIRAYELFRENHKLDHRLVLAGGRLFLNSETDNILNRSKWKQDIILTGPVRHKDLRMFYASAEALVFVPWFEGFGIPAAEAMRCGTPVILSGTTSLPEVGGRAAIYVKPEDPDGIAEAIHRIITDRHLRDELKSAGMAHSGKFTWENTALSVIDSIRKASGS